MTYPFAIIIHLYNSKIIERIVHFQDLQDFAAVLTVLVLFAIWLFYSFYFSSQNLKENLIAGQKME